MKDKKYKWHRIAGSVMEIPFGENNLAELNINGKNICVAKTGDTLDACVNKCPHAGGDLAEGWLDALGNIVCPVHRYKFSLKNGRNTSGEGYYIKIYPIVEKEDGLYIGIESPGWFSF
jgi:nitrite reductase/ring-hydroxylating ferredoxin subunit